MLTVARALVTNHELLLLDEPTEGFAPLIIQEIKEQVLKLGDLAISMLLAEQNIESALKITNRGYIIDNGLIRYEGCIEGQSKRVQSGRKGGDDMVKGIPEKFEKYLMTDLPKFVEVAGHHKPAPLV